MTDIRNKLFCNINMSKIFSKLSVTIIHTLDNKSFYHKMDKMNIKC